MKLEGQISDFFKIMKLYCTTRLTATNVLICSFIGRKIKLNNDNIETNGFPSGVFVDGSRLYPGTGNFDSIENRPSRILNTGNNSTSGAYSCQFYVDGEMFDNKTAYYYYAHPMLEWISIPVISFTHLIIMHRNFENEFGIIKEWNSKRTNFSYIARCNELINGKFYQTIGIFSEPDKQPMASHGSNNFMCRNFDVLACAVDPKDLPCGKIMETTDRFHPLHEKTPGLMSGVYIDNTPVFPGVMYDSKNNGFRPARVYFNMSYSPCVEKNSEIIQNREIDMDKSKENQYYFIAHHFLGWTLTNGILTHKIPGAVILQKGLNFSSIVARFNITMNNNTYQQIGVYEVNTSKTYYWNGTAIVSHKGMFEILTCSHCDNSGIGKNIVDIRIIVN